MDVDTDREKDAGGLSAGPAGEIAERIREADERLVTFVRERPLVALGAAVALGYLAGRIFSRVA